MKRSTSEQRNVLLVILDGFGLGPKEKGNAILRARMDYLNSLIANYPSASLTAAGLAVGLPWGTFGNSEVGHSSIGTGRVLVQDITRINLEIKNGAFFENKAFGGGN